MQKNSRPVPSAGPASPRARHRPIRLDDAGLQCHCNNAVNESVQNKPFFKTASWQGARATEEQTRASTLRRHARPPQRELKNSCRERPLFRVAQVQLRKTAQALEDVSRTRSSPGQPSDVRPSTTKSYLTRHSRTLGIIVRGVPPMRLPIDFAARGDRRGKSSGLRPPSASQASTCRFRHVVPPSRFRYLGHRAVTGSRRERPASRTCADASSCAHHATACVSGRRRQAAATAGHCRHDARHQDALPRMPHMKTPGCCSRPGVGCSSMSRTRIGASPAGRYADPSSWLAAIAAGQANLPNRSSRSGEDRGRLSARRLRAARRNRPGRAVRSTLRGR